MRHRDGSTDGVGPDADLSSALVLHEPGPAAALDASKGGVHLVLELVQAAIGAVDGLAKRSRGGLTTSSILGSQVLPEEAVVQVATAVEVDRRLEGNLGRNVTLGLGLLQLLKGGIVVVDVGLVMALVVELHDLAGDRGFQGSVVVFEG